MNKKKKIRFYTHKNIASDEMNLDFLSEMEVEAIQVDKLSQFNHEGRVNDDDLFLVSGNIIKKALKFRDRERSARKIMDHVADGIFVLDRKDEVVWANDAAREMTGYYDNEILRRDIYNLFDNPRFQGPIFVPTSACRESGETKKGEFHDAHGRFFEMEASLWNAPPGSPAAKGGKSVLVTVRDITELRSQLQKLRLIHEKGNELNEMGPEAMLELTELERTELMEDGVKQTVRKLMKYEMFELRTVGTDPETLELRSSFGMTPEVKKRVVKIAKEGYGINGYVAATRRSYLCPNVHEDPRYLTGGVNSQSSLTVPIMFRKTLMGVLNVESTKENAFTKLDEMYLEIFSRDIGVAMNTLRLLEEERKNKLKMNVEEIHKTLAMPVNEILQTAAKLLPLMEKMANLEDMVAPPTQKQRDDPNHVTDGVKMQILLYNIVSKAKAIRAMVLEIGEKMGLGWVAPVEHTQEHRDHILYVDATKNYRQEIGKFLSEHQTDVYLTESGREGLRMVKQAFKDHEPYYAILVSMAGVQDYANYVDFMDAVAAVYTDHDMNPPFVLLQKDSVRSVESRLLEANKRYHACRRVLLPFGLETLPDVIKQVAGPLFGQHILLVDPKMRDVESAREFLRRRGCALEVVTSGKQALKDIRFALSQEQPFAILLITAMDIPDYKRKTAFFEELVALYQEFDEKPPLVVARDLMRYDSDHVISNIRDFLIKYAEIVGIEYKEDLLMAAILNVMKVVEENPGAIVFTEEDLVKMRKARGEKLPVDENS